MGSGCRGSGVLAVGVQEFSPLNQRQPRLATQSLCKTLDQKNRYGRGALDDEFQKLRRLTRHTAGYEGILGGLATSFPLPYPWEPTYAPTLLPTVQGYLAHKKVPPPRTLQQDQAQGPVVVLGGA